MKTKTTGKNRGAQMKTTSIKTKLMMPVLLGLMIAFIVMIVLINLQMKQTIERDVTAQSQGTVEGLTGSVRAFLDQYENSIELFSGNEALKRYGTAMLTNSETSNEAIAVRFTQYLDIYGDALSAYFGTEDGTMNIFPEADMPEGYDPRERDWYKMAEGEEVPVWSEPYEDAATGMYVITVARAVYGDNGEMLGVIAADIDLTTMAERLQSTDPGYGGYNVAISPSGMGIVHPESQGEDLSDVPVVSEMLSEQKASNVKRYTIDGSERMLVYNTVPGVEWKVASVYEADNLIALASSIRTAMIWIAVIVLALASLILIGLISRTIRPLRTLEQSAARAAEGDLTVQVPVQSNDEIGRVSTAFNTMIQQMGGIVKRLNSSVEHVQESAEHLSAVAEQTNASGEQMTIAITEITEGIARSAEDAAEATEHSQELGRQMDMLAVQSDEMSGAAVEAKQANATGRAKMEELKQSNDETKTYITDMANILGALESKMNAIEAVIGTITDIAAQTNLLALNASIEAARAGEHGRGFAVVAEEVRKLAEQSRIAADDVRQTIASVQDESDTAVGQMKKTRENFDKQSTAVQEANGVFLQLATAVDKMESAIFTMNQEITDASSAKNIVLQSMESIAATSQQSAASSEEVSASAEEQSKAIHSVTESAEQLMELSQELGTLVRRFTV